MRRVIALHGLYTSKFRNVWCITKEVIMAKKVVVVRVGTKTIRIVHMDNSAVNPTVYGCVRVPTPQGSVVDGEVKNISGG